VSTLTPISPWRVWYGLNAWPALLAVSGATSPATRPSMYVAYSETCLLALNTTPATGVTRASLLAGVVTAPVP